MNPRMKRGTREPCKASEQGRSLVPLAEWEEQIVVGGQEGGSQDSLGERQQDMSQERTEGPERSE